MFDFELHFRALFDRLEAVLLEGTEMQEDVFTAVGLFDEAVALVDAELLHFSTNRIRHALSLVLCSTMIESLRGAWEASRSSVRTTGRLTQVLKTISGRDSDDKFCPEIRVHPRDHGAGAGDGGRLAWASEAVILAVEPVFLIGSATRIFQ